MPVKDYKAYYQANREKMIEKTKKYYRKNTELVKSKARARKLKEKYGLTKENIPSNCEVCGEGGKICVDHCHKTGQVRGFLCTSCNFVLGLVKDDTKILLRLRSYLTKAKKSQIIEHHRPIGPLQRKSK